MRWLRLAVVVTVTFVLAACGRPQPSTDGLHQSCDSATVICASGQQCLHYTNFAGQPIATCEIVCTGNPDCPGSLTCASVSEGPAQKICQ